MRASEQAHEYHKQMHAFTDEMERLFIVVILMLLGGAVVHGLLLPLTWAGRGARGGAGAGGAAGAGLSGAAGHRAHGR